MPPTSKTFGRLIGLGLSVRPSVRQCVTLALGREPLEIGSLNLVCTGRMSINIKKTRIFSCPWDLSFQCYCPFHFFYITCEQNITRTTRARVMIFRS